MPRKPAKYVSIGIIPNCTWNLIKLYHDFLEVEVVSTYFDNPNMEYGTNPDYDVNEYIVIRDNIEQELRIDDIYDHWKIQSGIPTIAWEGESILLKKYQEYMSN